MEQKRVLIYGDSNTHGYRVSDGRRFPKEVRWTGVCQHLLGESFEILEEGLNGRTTCFSEPFMEFRNGFAYIQPCIRTHLPLDLVCVMLGSNDLKKEFHQSAEQIAANSAKVLGRARQVVRSKYPDSDCRYLLMAPVEISEDMTDGPFAWEFEGQTTVEKSRTFSVHFQREAEKNDFLFFDASRYAGPGKADGLHLDEENHRRLGEAFAKWLRALWDETQ